MFYGIIIRIMFFDTKQYHLPPIHVEYQGEKSDFHYPGRWIAGRFATRKKTSLVKARIILHEEELRADWTPAVNGEPVFQIKPLQ